MKIFCAIFVMTSVFFSGAHGGGSYCTDLRNLSSQLSRPLQLEYGNVVNENYYTKTQNEQISLFKAETAVLLSDPDLSPQDLFILTTIENGGDVAAACLITFFYG